MSEFRQTVAGIKAVSDGFNRAWYTSISGGKDLMSDRDDPYPQSNSAVAAAFLRDALLAAMVRDSGGIARVVGVGRRPDLPHVHRLTVAYGGPIGRHALVYVDVIPGELVTEGVERE